MARLEWDNIGERFYETGVDHGVLYVRDNDGNYPDGVVWNGLTNISESPSGADATPLWADNTKYLNLISAEEFGATIEAYTYPDEFAACDGSGEIVKGVMAGQQTRKSFGLAYRTTLGNDVQTNDYGYKLHLIYGCVASPSDKSYATINDSPDAITFSWEVSTTPVPIGIDGLDLKPTASIVIDSTQVDADKLKDLEDILYGTATEEARLPLPAELAEIFAEA